MEERRVNADWESMDEALDEAMDAPSEWYEPPKDGTDVVRPLPGLDNDPAIVYVYEHMGLFDGWDAARCLGKECPSDVAAWSLMDMMKTMTSDDPRRKWLGDSGSKKSWKPGPISQLRCRKSALLNVLPRNLEEPMVQIWRTKPGFIKWYKDDRKDKLEQATRAKPPRTWNPWHPETGRDLTIVHEPNATEANRIWRYLWDNEGQPIGDHPWMDQLHNLHEKAFKRVTSVTTERMIDLLKSKWDAELAQHDLPTIQELLDRRAK